MQKIHKKWQLILYAAAGMGVNLLNIMMGTYLCSALLVGGFKGDALIHQTFEQKDIVIASLWAIFGLVAKIIDGVIDIPMASLTDNMKTRWGRRRPSLIIGMIPMIASYLLFLVCPNPTDATLINTIYYGVILCVFYSSYTLTMVTYYATFTEIVENEKDRNIISNTKAIFDIVYFIVGFVGVRALLNGLNIRTVALIVLPIVLTMLIPLFMIKETSDSIGTTGKAETVNLIKSIAHTFKNKNYIIWMFVYSFMTFGVQLFLSGINEYFSTVGMNMIFVMLAAFIPVPLTFIIYNKLLKKHGFGVSFRYTLIMYSIGMLAMFAVSFMATGTLRTVLSICTGLICSFAIGALFAVAYSVPAQLAAEEEEKTGVSNSAMYFAVQGLFSGIATGIGASVVLTALKNASKDVTAAVTPMFFLTLICAAGTIVSFILTFILPKSVTSMGKESSQNK